jgi:hypothetical protein
MKISGYGTSEGKPGAAVGRVIDQAAAGRCYTNS